MADDDQVKGTREMQEQAAAGLKLMQKDAGGEIEGDLDAAKAFKELTDAKIADLEKQSAALTGKDNKKARQEKDKEKTALKNDKQYIDAQKVCKGLPPVHGHFIKTGAEKPAPKEEKKEEIKAPEPEKEKKDAKKDEKKDDKAKKAKESAGISKEERAELETLKAKIIDKKATLKAQGMSGGQQNKDEEIVAWVARMNELKEKECPGSTTGKDKKAGDGKKKKTLDSAAQAQLEEKQRALEEYATKLREEFKYSKKEIAADPEYQEMKAEIDKMSK